MFADRVFQVTLLISLVVHGVILFQNPHFNFNPFVVKKKEDKVEVRYIKEPKGEKAVPKPTPPKKEPFLKMSSKITVQKSIPPPYVDKENIFKKSKEIALRKPTFAKPTFIQPDIIAVKKKVTLPAIDLDKINNPSYISYYQIVREKIRRAAYQNYTRTEVGQVYLCFVILSSGSLKDVQMVSEKSSPSPYLREIASSSIKDASPFPQFPKELDYPQLSFNVVISFEIE